MESYKTKSEEEIKNLALSLFKGEIFTSLQIKNQDDVPSVFMALALGDDQYIEWLKNNSIRVLYENMTKSLPRSINGYPIFTSHGHLDKDDTNKVLEKYKQIQKAMENL